MLPTTFFSRRLTRGNPPRKKPRRLLVFVDEEITGEVEALSIREVKKQYISKFSTRCIDNHGVLVLNGEAWAVLPTLCPADPLECEEPVNDHEAGSAYTVFSDFYLRLHMLIRADYLTKEI
ncbi:(R)-specific enoyl-CoA hydratase [Tanacetum coccineum]